MTKNFIMKILILITLLGQSVLLAFSPISIASDSTKLYYQKNPVYKQRVEMFKLNKLNHPDIVMFGDSHTQGANWNELLGKYKVVNRGIAGDDTQGMLARINSVINLHPKIVVVQGGINDIYNWVPTDVVFKNLKRIITIIKKSGAKPIVVSVIFSGRKWGEDWIKMHRPDIDVPKYNKERNEEVQKLNRLLKDFCAKNNVEFVDINKYLSNGNFLKDEYSRDNLHLNAKGYRIWRRELLKAIHN
jgi:lysophospholipase L1-like esterase